MRVLRLGVGVFVAAGAIANKRLPNCEGIETSCPMTFNLSPNPTRGCPTVRVLRLTFRHWNVTSAAPTRGCPTVRVLRRKILIITFDGGYRQQEAAQL